MTPEQVKNAQDVERTREIRGIGDEHQYGTESYGIQSRPMHGSKEFYKLLEEMAETHDKKSHDYASNENPFGNYYFAGELAKLFSYSSQDAGFVGRLAEKIYRIAMLESSGKIPQNESIEDTEKDVAVIAVLWMASRRERRLKQNPSLNEINDRYLKKHTLKSPLEAEQQFIDFLNRIRDNPTWLWNVKCLAEQFYYQTIANSPAGTKASSASRKSSE